MLSSFVIIFIPLLYDTPSFLRKPLFLLIPIPPPMFLIIPGPGPILMPLLILRVSLLPLLVLLLIVLVLVVLVPVVSSLPLLPPPAIEGVLTVRSLLDSILGMLEVHALK